MGIIGTIRKHSGWAVAIVGIAIVCFIIGDLTKNGNKIPDLGIIDGRTITSQVFNARVAEYEENYKAQTGALNVDNETEYQIREQVWQSLVQETLLGEQMAKLGIEVGARELSDMYSGDFIHPYLRQSFTDPATGQYNYQYVKSVADNFDQIQDTLFKTQWIQMEKQIKEDRAQQKYMSMIQGAFYTPNAMAKYLAELGTTSSDCRVAMASFQSVSDDEVTLKDEDYKKYYDEHKAELRVRDEIRNIDFVLFPINPTQEDLANIKEEVDSTWAEFQTTTEDLAFFVNDVSETQYDSTFMKASDFPAPFDSIIVHKGEGSFIEPMVVGNAWMMGKVVKTDMRPDSLRASVIWVLNSKAGAQISRTEEQAKHLADSVAALIRGGMPIEEATNQFSDGDKSKGGDEGWQKDGQYGFLNDEILSNPVGSVVVVDHPQGVGQCVVAITGKTTPMKKYRVALITRNMVPSSATEKTIYNNATKFAGQYRTHDEMIAAAQEQNLMVRNAQVRIMDNSIAGVANVREVVQWTYEETTQENTVADKVFNSDNAYLVVALKDVYKKGILPLEQARPMIENNVRLEKKAELLMARAEEAMGSTKDINVLAQKMGTTVDSLNGVNFNDYYLQKYGMEPKVQAAITAAGKGKMVGPVKGANGVYIVQVDNTYAAPVPEGVSAEDAAKSRIEGIRQQMQQANSQKANSVFTVLKDQAKIVDQRNKFF